MSAQVPESTLTTNQLLTLAAFNRALADDLDYALSHSGNPGIDEIDLLNGEATTVVAGTPVYISASGAFMKAKADALATGWTIGITKEDIVSGGIGGVHLDGSIELTTAQWDAVAGSTGGLAFNVPYYLSAASAGRLSVTVPNVNSHVVQLVLIGVTPTLAVVRITEPFVIGSGSNVVMLRNDNASPMIIGEPVYSSSAEGVDKARANNSGKGTVIGLVADVSIASGARGKFVTSDLIVASTAQWDAVCGTSGGLTYNTNYYLSMTTPGRLTSTPPTSPADDGNEVVLVMTALSATEARITIQPPVLL